MRIFSSVVLLGFIFISLAAADSRPAPATGPATAPATTPSTEPSSAKLHVSTADDKLSVTHHQITLDGNALSYDATAGTMLMRDESGKARANFFFVAYVKQDVTDASTRPITFVFNGGPGAAAVWLHLGAVGPQRIALDEQGFPGPPPHHLIDNPQTWLDLSDLVFIDPVGTGFSRPAEGQKAEDFYGYQQDISSVGEFIRLYLTRNERWGSPKFLAGESYGTTRAAGLSDYLIDRFGIDLNGIILMSTVLNFATIEPSDGNDLPYALYLPTYASVAAYHKKLGDADLSKLLPEVEHYALNQYTQALAAGSSLSKEDRAAVVDHLSRYTGLPPDLIDKSNLRIDPWQFRQKLLEDHRLVLGRFDARVTGYDPNPTDPQEQYDPSLSRYLPVYASAFNEYVRASLKYDSDLTYEVLSGRVGPWDFGRNGHGYLDVTGDLRSAMLKNPSLKILVCSGHDDLATPYLATKYTFDRLDLTGHLSANVTLAFYDSGHMIYHQKQSIEKLKQDVTEFFHAAASK